MKHLIIHSTLVLAMVISGCGDSNEQGRPQGGAILEGDTSVIDDLSKEKYEDLLRRLESGEYNFSKDDWELLLPVMDLDDFAKKLVDQKILGSRLNFYIEKIINVLKENPGRYDELTKRMDDAIETVLLNNKEFPEELISPLKKDIRGRIDDAIGDISKSEVKAN